MTTCALCYPNPCPEGRVEDGVLDFCHACGKPFKGREKWTVADWFVAGPPPRASIVHVRCRHKKRRDYAIQEAAK